MTKLFFLYFACFTAFAGNNNSIALRDEFLRTMRGFKPATIIPSYTEKPREQSLQPNEKVNRLSQLGRERLEQNKEAKALYQQAEQSHTVTANMNTPEMQVAGSLIENAALAPIGADRYDKSRAEVSDDLNEGLVRLGALSETASEVSAHQVRSGMPAIFAGEPLLCENYILGIRDCCTDSGWGDWVIHCPAHLQALQKAKAENRVFYLGSYRKHRFDLDKKHVYCVFPTKLAGILQLQGRLAQLNLAFGTTKEPNCRGMTPEELARINFQSLDLSTLRQDFRNRTLIPNAAKQGQYNKAHIERLNDKGRAHD